MLQAEAAKIVKKNKREKKIKKKMRNQYLNKYGPGWRVYSERALLLPVAWGNKTFILRLSTVDHDVPCLISRLAMKTLQRVIDLNIIWRAPLSFRGSHISLLYGIRPKMRLILAGYWACTRT